MNILAIDTTADFCSVAVLCDGQTFQFHECRPREHAKLLLPLVDDLLKKAGCKVGDLDYIVFGKGPGSFTGVRIATGVAQGLALSADVRLLPVSTLQSLAWSAAKQGASTIYAAIDARMSEIYVAEYAVSNDGIPVIIDEEQVLPPSSLELKIKEGGVFVGNGWACDYGFPENVSGYLSANRHMLPELPIAADSAELALKLLKHSQIAPVLPEDALPTYLRDNVTWDKKPKVGS